MPPINPVSVSGSDEIPLCDQFTATTTAAALTSYCTFPAGKRINEILLQNDAASGVNVVVGNATEQNIVIVPGSSLTIPLRVPSALYVKSASSTATVNVLARS